MPQIAEGAWLPLFQKYTLEELHRRTKYKLSYLLGIRDGQHPVRPRFKFVMSRILNESEAALFGADGEEEGSA